MIYQAENLLADKHCFFGSEGGVSQGKYASLNTNLRSQDKRENVLRNIDIIANKVKLHFSDLATVRQGVSNNTVLITAPSWYENVADGMVTTRPGIGLCIKTADCAPVFFADYKQGVIGAAHAGWRGALAGVVENVLLLMLQNGAQKKNIAAAIGPCLQKESFEVHDDMRKLFLEQNPENDKYFCNKFAKCYFNLSAYIENKLYCCGIENVVNSKLDTYQEKNGYFSYRRNTHKNLITQQFDYPTQYSVICL